VALAILAAPGVAARLGKIASAVTTTYVAQTRDELEAIVRDNPITTVIVSPAVDGTLCIEEVSDLARKYPLLHFIVYASVSPESLSTILQLNRSGALDVVTEGFDDSPHMLRAKLIDLESSALARTNFQGLLPPLHRLPAEMARALNEMFQRPQNFTSTLDLARAAGVAVSSLYTSFELAQIASPRDFLVAARVWHGYSYLSGPGETVRTIAAHLGYKQTRVFASHVRKVFGVPPSALRATLSVSEARDRIFRWLSESR
jgi:AraC-like DNA-binding protein